MIRIIFYGLIALVVFFISRLLIRLFNQPSERTIHSYKRNEEKKFENIQDAQFTEIKSDDSKKNE